MKKITTYCDHCGKELNETYDYCEAEINTYRDVYITDLCEDCMIELDEMVTKFISTTRSEKENKDK